MSTNITRAEARTRSDLISVDSIAVELDLTTGPETFRSVSTVVFHRKPDTEPADTWFDLIAPHVHSITLNGKELPVSEHFDGFRIHLPQVAQANTLVVVADCAYMRTGEGLHRFVDPIDDEAYLYSQFEVADARRVYVCADQPNLKIRWQLTVTAPAHWRIFSNSPTPEPTQVSADSARWEFAPTPPIPSYITAVIAGPYEYRTDTYEGEYGSYPLGVAARASLAKHLDDDDIFLITKQGFAYFEKQYQTGYVFGKYDQIFVPEFNAGAMENAGCVTHHEDLVFQSRVTAAAYESRSNTILHELAHMWFGNLVTMSWWDDLWLNESFAEWASHDADHRATRFSDAWTTFATQRKAWAYRQDQLPSTHPIAADMVDLDTVEVSFDGITYAKGASALRQLVAWVGEENFLAGIRTYFKKFAWGNSTLADLLAELSATSGRDLSEWTTQWLQTSGVNTLALEAEAGADGTYHHAIMRQQPPSAPAGVSPTLRQHRIGIGLYDVIDGVLTRRDTFEIDVAGEETEVSGLLGYRQADLLLPNDRDLTFAKIRLDERSMATAISYVHTLEDSLPRALIYAAVWDMVRDGELPARAMVDLAVGALPHERDIVLVQQLLRQLDAVVNAYADPEHAPGYRIRLTHMCGQASLAAAAGSDHQLAFVRGYATFASTPAELERVLRLYEGTDTQELEGLILDAGLRWHLLGTLVRLGTLGEDAIAAELTRDPGASGVEHATELRASIPTMPAREHAFNRIIHEADLSNTEVNALIAGVNQPDQPDLMRPLIPAYFAALPDIWRTRTTEIAQNITEGLFPDGVIEPETIQAATEFLAQSEYREGMHRLVREGIDGCERALQARMRDAAPH